MEKQPHDSKMLKVSTDQPQTDFDIGDGEQQIINERPQMPGLQRRLRSRHLQMIAIGGTIGTGLFIGSGSAISYGGPVGALLAFVFVGTIVCSVMTSLGEIATYLPIPGGFAPYAARLIDPSLGFALGWVYWFSWVTTFALELTATGLIIQYWENSIPIAIFIAVFWVLIVALNLLPVTFYGEIEFWLSSVKVLTIIGFMIFAICINAGAGAEGYIGFRYWVKPGPFNEYLIKDNPALARFVGFWAVMIKAGFAYGGTELIGMAVGEAVNPRKTIPSAIRKVFYRIAFFFVFTVFFIGIVVPSNDHRLTASAEGGASGSNANASPLVLAAKRAGVKVLPSLINSVLLTVVLSAANSNVYTASRTLIGLAQEGFAPRIFTKTTKSGVPYWSVLFTSLFGLLGFLNVSNTGSTVFEWLMQMAGLAGFITWASLNACHLAFMNTLKAREISRDTLPYKAFWQPYFSYYGIFFNVLIMFTQGFTAFIPHFKVVDFFINYLSLILFVLLWIGHKLIFRPAFVRPGQADIGTGRVDDEVR